MKVLFVIPPGRSLFGDRESSPCYPHLGIAYLTAVLKKQNINVKISDCSFLGDNQEIINLAKELKPDLIGVTGFSYAYQFFYDICELIKKNLPTPLIIGGPHVSVLRKNVLMENPADFAIKGEGEITLLEFLEKLRRGEKDFGSVLGLIWRKNEEIIENEDRPWIENLDILPFPDFEAFNFKKYRYYDFKTLPIITSRGCPYNCIFCGVKVCMGRNFRARSAQNVFEEINYWNEKGFNNFEINDDCFSLDLKRAEDICELIINSKLKITFQLNNGIRVDRVTLPLLSKMKKAGCTFIAFGCESGNEQVLKNIKKNVTLEQTRQAVNWANQVEIKNSVNFIFGHPGETYKSAEDTLKFAKFLPTNFVNMYNLIPYPGTELYGWVKNNTHLLIPEKDYLQKISCWDNYPIFETKDYTAKERRKILKEAFAVYERKVLQFRFGKLFGYLIYLIGRFRPLMKIGRKFALTNKFGYKIYRRLASH